MTKAKIVGLTIVSVMIFSLASSRAQLGPASGFYKIASGKYGGWAEVFGGPNMDLRDTNQSPAAVIISSPWGSWPISQLGGRNHVARNS